MERKNFFKVRNPIMELKQKAMVINNLMDNLKRDSLAKPKDYEGNRQLYLNSKIVAGKISEYLSFAKRNSLYLSGAKMTKIQTVYTKLVKTVESFKNKYE